MESYSSLKRLCFNLGNYVQLAPKPSLSRLKYPLCSSNLISISYNVLPFQRDFCFDYHTTVPFPSSKERIYSMTPHGVLLFFI
jgi:hypothetical protein